MHHHLRHTVRHTAEKLGKRLRLVAPLVYRRMRALEPLRYQKQGSPLEPPLLDADTAGWEQLETGSFWGAPRTEFTLLEMFLRRPRRVLDRSFILEEVWGYDFPTSANSLEVYVGYLRRKTEAEGESRLIQTVRGVGYVLKEA